MHDSQISSSEPESQDQLKVEATEVIEKQAESLTDEKSEVKAEIKQELKKDIVEELVAPPTEQIDQAVQVLQEVQVNEDQQKQVINEQVNQAVTQPAIADPEPQSFEKPVAQPVDRVSQLTHEELEAATKIILTERLQKARKTSLSARNAKQASRTEAIKNFVKNNSSASINAISRALSLNPRQVEYCIQKLVKDGQLKASGNAKTRKYFVS